MADNYQDFLKMLAMHESRGHGGYQAVNGSYLGKYQMGPAALTDVGYMKAGEWCGKNGVTCDKDFLDKPSAQEDAILQYHSRVWSAIQKAKLDRHVGKEINGVKITPYGMLAAAHLKGIGTKDATDNSLQGLRHYLESNGAIDPTDGNGTPVSKYLQNMAGYEHGTGPSPLKPADKTPKTLKIHSSGDEVRLLQNILNQTGDTLTVDGKFGPNTQKAVEAFQQKHHLDVDGIVGPKTWKALTAVVTKEKDEPAAAETTTTSYDDRMQKAKALAAGKIKSTSVSEAPADDQAERPTVIAFSKPRTPGGRDDLG